MSKLKILIVEDEAPLRNLIRTTLYTHDYAFETAENGRAALMVASSLNPDLVLLDLGLPDLDGIEVIKRIRSWSNMPIIVLTARSEMSDKIAALDSGADDYLTKPFAVEELLARIRVIQRRLSVTQTRLPEEQTFVNGDLKIDFSQGCAFMGENELRLTPSEYKLLCILARNVGRVLTYRFISREIWGNEWESNTGSLRVFMATLRKKLEKGGRAQSYIQTHVGVGYRMMKL
ncbi:MAG: response regulator transcription factor [Lachnospiraceae bacterium]|nr:response regulator transcription factor [Lachnospiraceae bacterium]